jgi:hypothetical protein
MRAAAVFATSIVALLSGYCHAYPDWTANAEIYQSTFNSLFDGTPADAKQDILNYFLPTYKQVTNGEELDFDQFVVHVQQLRVSGNYTVHVNQFVRSGNQVAERHNVTEIFANGTTAPFGEYFLFGMVSPDGRMGSIVEAVLN